MLGRNLMREFRPFFRMLDEPLTTRSPSYWGPRSSFESPFFGIQSGLRPAVDVTEHGNNYVLEAELPGVKKEDVEVHIGDNGRSVIIEGKIFSRKGRAQPVEGSSTLPSEAQSTPVTIEREFTGQSTFTRTISLPNPVDSNNVSAKLADGVLVVTIPKASDPERVKVSID